MASALNKTPQKQPEHWAGKDSMHSAREVAQGAFRVLLCLLDNKLLPAKQVAENEIVLARSDGLLRCSALMCPAYTQTEGPQRRQGTSV